jgi:streptogramin lyase
MSNNIAFRITNLAAATTVAVFALAGCAVQSNVSSVSSPGVLALPAFAGNVHGGQQPVSGATIQIYAAGSGGYGTAATPLIAGTITTNATGAFQVSNPTNYTCPANSYVYVVATGGNPGLGTGTNNNLALMAALGPCSALTPSTFVNINEVTTVASVWSLARFMTGYASMGTSSTNTAGLVNAFAAVNKVVNIATGTMPGAALPAQASFDMSEVNTLANILGACVNSAGGAATNTTTACGTLFNAATPSGGSAPTDTIAAAVNIARNPSANLTALYGLSSSMAPFQPSLSTQPTNFLIGINYQGGGLSAPKGLAVDASGNIWVANSGNSSLTELSNVGTALSSPTGLQGGGLSGPSAVAIDLSGNVWVANATGSSVSKYLVASSAFVGTPYGGGGLNAPRSISIDGSGNVWLANSGANSVSEFNASGTALSPAMTGYTGAGITTPTGIAINPHQ